MNALMKYILFYNYGLHTRWVPGLNFKDQKGYMCLITCKWKRLEGILVSHYVMTLVEGLHA
jgi:hypothetical protein